MPAAKRALSDTTMTVRLPTATKKRFEAAAKAKGTTVTNFVIEELSASADDVLLDQKPILLNEIEWERLQRLLENPPPPNEKLKALLKATPPWT